MLLTTILLACLALVALIAGGVRILGTHNLSARLEALNETYRDGKLHIGDVVSVLGDSDRQVERGNKLKYLRWVRETAAGTYLADTTNFTISVNRATVAHEWVLQDADTKVICLVHYSKVIYFNYSQMDEEARVAEESGQAEETLSEEATRELVLKAAKAQRAAEERLKSCASHEEPQYEEALSRTWDHLQGKGVELLVGAESSGGLRFCPDHDYPCYVWHATSGGEVFLLRSMDFRRLGYGRQTGVRFDDKAMKLDDLGIQFRPDQNNAVGEWEVAWRHNPVVGLIVKVRGRLRITEIGRRAGTACLFLRDSVLLGRPVLIKQKLRKVWGHGI